MWTVTASAQREQLRTLNASQTSQRAACVSCSRRFRPAATSFELRYRSYTSELLGINFMQLNFQFFPVNLEIIVWNVTSPNKLRCAIAKFELKV